MIPKKYHGRERIMADTNRQKDGSDPYRADQRAVIIW